MNLSVSPRVMLRLFLHSQMLPILESGEETLVGGQAVMEGVMMRAPHSYCVAVRRQDGSIVTDEKPLPRLSERHKIFKLPIFRGVGTLYQALKLGYGALKFSTDQALADLQPASPESKPPKEMPRWAITGNLLFSIAFMIFLYKFMPLLLTTKLGKVYPLLTGRIPFNLAEGIIRVAILVAFLYVVSRFSDMRRIFQYHGAEHKVVFNFESGEPVTVGRAQQFTTFHPRCGTSFLMMLMFVAVPVYALIPFDGFAAKFICRLALLPLIIGLSYEVIRFAARRRDSLLAVVAAPGLWLQRITTQPPSDDQVETAIAALNEAMELEKQRGGELVIA